MPDLRRIAIGIGLILASAVAPLPAQHPEVRAMWVQRASLTSPTSVLSVVEMAAAAGFNTLIVQVRGRGDAFYRSDREPRAVALAPQPSSFDPLALMVARAHRAGLKVHAWVNINLISEPAPNQSPQHVVNAHPEWLMVPRPLAAELASMNPKRPEFLQRLSEYAKARSDRVEGLFLSPLNEDAVAHTVRVIGDIASRYELDGIHLDYIRFPNDEFDFSAEALSEFRSDVRENLSRSERREYDERARDRPLF